MNPKSKSDIDLEARSIVVSRVFAAPCALVFKAWTESKHMARWWGPHGYTTPVCELDARPGGTFRITMAGPDGIGYRIKGTYLEVVANERLVYTMLADDGGADWGEGRPRDAVHVVTFEEHDGNTTLTVVTQLNSIEDRDFMARMGHSEGLGQSLDRLEALLTAI